MASQPVLIVIEIDAVNDVQSFKQYQIAAREQMLARGARVIARGGSTIEGEPAFGSLLIQEWPSEEASALMLKDGSRVQIRSRNDKDANVIPAWSLLQLKN